MNAPTPEAIEAAEAGMRQRMTWASLHWNALDPDQQRELATAALSAAYPLMEAASAWCHNCECPSCQEAQAKAATIEAGGAL